MSEVHKPNSLKRDAAYVYTGYFLRYLSVLILVPYYGRVLGPASYGKVLSAMSLMSIVWMVVNYGFSMTGTRELSLVTDDTKHGSIFGKHIVARLIMFPAGILIGAVGTYLSPALSSEPWYGVIATILGLISAMNLGWFFQGLRKFRISLICEAISYPFNVLFILLLVKNERDGIYAMIGMLASAVMSSLITYIIAIGLLKSKKIIFADGFKEIKSASTIFIQSINSMMMTAGSTYILSVLSTPDQVGYFGSAEKLVSFALAFLGPAGQVLMPTITHRSVHAPYDARSLVQKSILFEISYGICAFLGGIILAPIIIQLVFGQKFLSSVPLFMILVFALPFMAFSHSVGLYCLIPLKKEKWLVSVATLSNIFNLILIAALTHKLGGVGVSIARLASEVLTAFLLFAVLVKLNISLFKNYNEEKI